MELLTAELLHPGGTNPSNHDFSGLIPYKNPKALIAYYISIAGALPIIGFPFALTAFVLGIMGLKDRKKNPKIKGAVHAWIGIGCGGLFALIWFAMVSVMIIAFVFDP